MTVERIEACLADAAASPMAAEGVTYPSWYLHRWHFLPEGYLSRRSLAAYDAVIRRVYNTAAESSLHARLVRVVRSDSPSRLLEVGCGPGNALAALSRALPRTHLTGIDLSPFALEFARDRLPLERAELVHGDATRLPWPDASFDAVLSQHVLGHLPRAAAGRAWREAARVLRPGGRLYLLEHAWHPRPAPGLALTLRQRLLGGIIRLERFERMPEPHAAR